MHNTSVLLSSHSDPIVAPDTYVEAPKGDAHLAGYASGHLLDRYSLADLMLFNTMLDIKPRVPGLFFKALECAEYRWESKNESETTPAVVHRVPNWPELYLQDCAYP
jgi:hypothetical protein